MSVIEKIRSISGVDILSIISIIALSVTTYLTLPKVAEYQYVSILGWAMYCIGIIAINNSNVSFKTTIGTIEVKESTNSDDEDNESKTPTS